MVAYVVVDLNILSKEHLAKYKEKAPGTVKAHGGKFLVSGKIKSLTGVNNFQMKSIIEFPSQESVLTWYESDEYQSLIETRDRGIDCRFDLIV